MTKTLKFLTCFKVVRELDTALEEDWQAASDSGFTVDYTRKSIGNFDESALENCLYLAEQATSNGYEARTTALIICDDNISGILSNLYAVGFSTVACIRPECDLSYNPKAVAKIITSYIQANGGFDCVFFGSQASVGNHGQTATIIAHNTGYNFVNIVNDISFEQDKMVVQSQINNCARSADVNLPCILAMENSKRTYLRIATLKEKLAKSKLKPVYSTLSELGLSAQQLEQTQLVIARLYREKQQRSCSYIENATPHEIAEQLFVNYIGKVVDKK